MGKLATQRHTPSSDSQTKYFLSTLWSKVKMTKVLSMNLICRLMPTQWQPALGSAFWQEAWKLQYRSRVRQEESSSMLFRKSRHSVWPWFPLHPHSFCITQLFMVEEGFSSHSSQKQIARRETEKATASQSTCLVLLFLNKAPTSAFSCEFSRGLIR